MRVHWNPARVNSFSVDISSVRKSWNFLMFLRGWFWNIYVITIKYICHNHVTIISPRNYPLSLTKLMALYNRVSKYQFPFRLMCFCVVFNNFRCLIYTILKWIVVFSLLPIPKTVYSPTGNMHAFTREKNNRTNNWYLWAKLLYQLKD